MLGERGPASERRKEKAIAAWLFAMCAMVFVMVVLGGLTRLTHSGLSMVEWQLLHVLPPLTETEWQDAFEKYKQFPEYRELNSDMTLQGFKSIFWLEFVHRLWGRAIGFAFLLPLLWFWSRGWVDRALLPRLLVMFALGGLQGALGWYMVKSGLVDRPDVSQYRLTAHFGAALAIYGYMLWVALSLAFPEEHAVTGRQARGLRRLAAGVAMLVFVTALAGGFVAGLDAGLTYNTFPLMDGALVPDGLFIQSPWWINFFENVATVQFDHRLLAETTVVVVMLFWGLARRATLAARTRTAINLLLAVALAQLGLGIATLLLVAPVPLASLHQAGAVALFSAALWVLHELRTR
jgi:cytochrome c oxidase assembly protein subunit 15